jgi:hypothetical protein
VNMDLLSGGATLATGSVSKVRRVNEWEWQAVMKDVADRTKWQELDGEYHLADRQGNECVLLTEHDEEYGYEVVGIDYFDADGMIANRVQPEWAE